MGGDGGHASKLGAAFDPSGDGKSVIEVLIEDQGWDTLSPEQIAEDCLDAAGAELPSAPLSKTVTALLTSDEAVQALNRDFREKDKPTNVLSFPAEPMPGLPEEMQPLGDLALARETCLREAADKGISAKDHVAHLIVHGLLHLLGYDHLSEGEAEEMETLERRILERLGISDPYAEQPGP